MEFDADENTAGKVYQQSGETMGVIRYDGSYRPVCGKIRGLSAARAYRPAAEPENKVCVLMPSPIFYSNYRYRANQTTFGIFNSLARAGVNADARFTSSGEKLLDPELLSRYKLVVLGSSTYRRDHPETVRTLLNYVQKDGNLIFAPNDAGSILDEHGNRVESADLSALTGAKTANRRICREIKDIVVCAPDICDGSGELCAPVHGALNMTRKHTFSSQTCPAAPRRWLRRTGSPFYTGAYWKRATFLYSLGVLMRLCLRAV